MTTLSGVALQRLGHMAAPALCARPGSSLPAKHRFQGHRSPVLRQRDIVSFVHASVTFDAHTTHNEWPSVCYAHGIWHPASSCYGWQGDLLLQSQFH